MEKKAPSFLSDNSVITSLSNFFKYGGSFISAVLLFFSLPPFSLSFLAWWALVPLWFSLSKLSYKKAWLNASLGGLLFHLLSLYWLNYVTVLGYIGLVFYGALYWLAFAWLWCRCKGPGRFISGIIIWVILQWARGLGPLAFPWGYVAHSMWQQPMVMGWVSFGGLPLLNFFIISVSALITAGLLANSLNIFSRNIILSLLIILLVYNSRMFFPSPEVKTTKTLRVAGLQGNFSLEEKADAHNEVEILNIYLDLTTKASSPKSDLIIWPETALPFTLPEVPEIAKQLQKTANKNNTNILLGAYDNSNVPYRWGTCLYNTAFFFQPTTDFNKTTSIPRYYKNHLVPYGEYVPLSKLFPFIKQKVEIAGGGGFVAGKKLTVFKLKDSNFSCLICFESLLPGLARKMVNHGAQWLIGISNDAWFYRSPAALQHFAYSVFRSAELAVPYIQVTNTGVTGAVAASGKVLKIFPAWQRGIFRVDIQPGIIEHKTVYARLGDWPIFLGFLFLTFRLLIIKKIGLAKRR